MKDSPTITWIVPAYNAEPFLRQALDSIFAQTVSDWEIIIIDDGSTDATPQIAAEYAARDSRVRVLSTEAPSGGAFTPRKTGILNAKGKWVAPLDADDFVGPNYLENLLARMRQTGADAVYPTMYDSSSGYKNPISSISPDLLQEGMEGKKAVRHTLMGWSIHCNGGLVPSSTYLEAFGEFPDEADCPADTTADELLTRYILYALPKVASASEKYYYRQHPGQQQKFVSCKRFNPLIHLKHLVIFIRERYGVRSEEHLLAQETAFYATFSAMRDMLKPGCSGDVRRYARKQISSLREEISTEDIKCRVDPYYLAVYKLPERVRPRALQIADRSKESLRKLIKFKHTVGYRLWQLKRELSIYADTRRISRGAESRMEPDRELDALLYTGRTIGRSKTENKKAICILDGNMHHGGLTDRLRGILSAYDEAKKSGRDFHIMWDDPFPLSDYLEPATFDWRLSRDSLQRDRGKARVVVVDDLNDFQSRRRLKAAMRLRVEEIHLYTNSDSSRGKYARLYRELFRPSALLEQSLQPHKSALAKGYWSVSFRFLGRLGDFNDCIEFNLSAQEQEELMERSLEALNPLLAKLPADYRLLVASDSHRFLKKAEEHDGRIYVVPGYVKHIDRDGKEGSDGWLKTFVDQQLIMGAGKVFRMVGPMVYPTGFPRFAAEVGETEFHDIHFKTQ